MQPLFAWPVAGLTTSVCDHPLVDWHAQTADVPGLSLRLIGFRAILRPPLSFGSHKKELQTMASEAPHAMDVSTSGDSSESDFEEVDASPEDMETIMHLETVLQTNPNLYESHVQV